MQCLGDLLRGICIPRNRISYVGRHCGSADHSRPGLPHGAGEFPGYNLLRFEFLVHTDNHSDRLCVLDDGVDHAIGSAGNYTLKGRVVGSPYDAPTGLVSFLDASNGDYSLGSADVGAGTVAWNGFTSAASPTHGRSLACNSRDTQRKRNRVVLQRRVADRLSDSQRRTRRNRRQHAPGWLQLRNSDLRGRRKFRGLDQFASYGRRYQGQPNTQLADTRPDFVRNPVEFNPTQRHSQRSGNLRVHAASRHRAGFRQPNAFCAVHAYGHNRLQHRNWPSSSDRRLKHARYCGASIRAKLMKSPIRGANHAPRMGEAHSTRDGYA